MDLENLYFPVTEVFLFYFNYYLIYLNLIPLI
jgi:hypothetical protein